MQRGLLAVLGLTPVLFVFGCSSVQSDAERYPAEMSFLGKDRLHKSVSSWKELQQQNIIMQGHDYSCGAGALATLMRYYFQDDVTEDQVLANILGTLTGEEVHDREKNGLSLLDLKRCAESMGYQAVGVRLKYASLPKLKGPVLIHLEREGYKHFAVLKGVRGDRVFLADPSRGNIRMSIDRFAQEWTGVALVLGKRGFGLPSKYPLALDDQEPVQNELLAARRALYLH
jgi:predicted double-glycine peptidase